MTTIVTPRADRVLYIENNYTIRVKRVTPTDKNRLGLSLMPYVIT